MKKILSLLVTMLAVNVYGIEEAIITDTTHPRASLAALSGIEGFAKNLRIYVRENGAPYGLTSNSVVRLYYATNMTSMYVGTVASTSINTNDGSALIVTAPLPAGSLRYALALVESGRTNDLGSGLLTVAASSFAGGFYPIPGQTINWLGLSHLNTTNGPYRFSPGAWSGITTNADGSLNIPAPSAGSVNWGAIIGAIGNQTDLTLSNILNIGNSATNDIIITGNAGGGHTGLKVTAKQIGVDASGIADGIIGTGQTDAGVDAVGQDTAYGLYAESQGSKAAIAATANNGIGLELQNCGISMSSGVPVVDSLGNLVAFTNWLQTNTLAGGASSASTNYFRNAGNLTNTTVLGFLPLDGSKAMTGALNAGGNFVTNSTGVFQNHTNLGDAAIAAYNYADSANTAAYNASVAAGNALQAATNAANAATLASNVVVTLQTSNTTIYAQSTAISNLTASAQATALYGSNTVGTVQSSQNVVVAWQNSVSNYVNDASSKTNWPKIPSATNANYATTANVASNLTSSLSNTFWNMSSGTNWPVSYTPTVLSSVYSNLFNFTNGIVQCVAMTNAMTNYWPTFSGTDTALVWTARMDFRIGTQSLTFATNCYFNTNAVIGIGGSSIVPNTNRTWSLLVEKKMFDSNVTIWGM